MAFIALLANQSLLALELNRPGSGEAIEVQADEAWEDANANITFYRGHFELRTSSYSVAADQATVYGSLQDPERVLMQGAPARILLRNQLKSGSVSASGEQIEYQLATQSVTISGGAELRDGANTVVGESIRYDVRNDRFSAADKGRIRVSINPEGN